MRRWRTNRSNRLNARKRTSHRPVAFYSRLRKILFPTLIGILIMSTGWLITNTIRNNHWFSITRIIVKGQLNHVKADEVVGLLPIRTGDNLLIAKLDDAMTALYRHPWIESARIERQYPHTLVVSVLEEKPVAILSSPQYFYVNRNGLPFKPVEKHEEMDFPLLLVPANTDLPSSSENDRKTIHEMIDFLNKYEQTRFAAEFGTSELAANSTQFNLFSKKGGVELVVSRDAVDEQLYKLDKYYPDILSAHPDQIGLLDLQLRGKIVARAKVENKAM